jgi:hypothetical protein
MWFNKLNIKIERHEGVAANGKMNLFKGHEGVGRPIPSAPISRPLLFLLGEKHSKSSG